mgnify:CR=1 FL=1
MQDDAEGRTQERRAEWTSDRLRRDIDRGKGGDKVVHDDLAAAPLGTDDEAAGTPPSAADVATAHAQETSGTTTDARQRARDWSAGPVPSARPWVIGAGLLVVVVLLVWWLAV